MNRKTDIVANMTLHVGIEEKWEVQCMYDPHFLAKGLNSLTTNVVQAGTKNSRPIGFARRNSTEIPS